MPRKTRHSNDQNYRYGCDRCDREGNVQQIYHRNVFRVVFHIAFSISDRE
jgi:hypothetical protein